MWEAKEKENSYKPSQFLNIKNEIAPKNCVIVKLYMKYNIKFKKTIFALKQQTKFKSISNSLVDIVPFLTNLYTSTK